MCEIQYVLNSFLFKTINIDIEFHWQTPYLTPVLKYRYLSTLVLFTDTKYKILN